MAGTDFWQGTHYGFRVDNGHALLAEIGGDFALETRVRTQPVHQYDQAGLMVRLIARVLAQDLGRARARRPQPIGRRDHQWWLVRLVDPGP